MQFAQAFARERMSADVFAEAYIVLWKIERDSGALNKDDEALGQCLSNFFCASDMYCGDDADRLDHELDAEQLHAIVVAGIAAWENDTCV